MLLCHIRLGKENKHEGKQERFWVGRLLVIHWLFIIDFCARAEGSRVPWEEEDGNVQRAVYARELVARAAVCGLSVAGFWIVGYLF